MREHVQPHTFHIPVLGLGYTIDTPVKVAPYGISSVISLVDDLLMERMREFYCKKFGLPFQSITNQVEDYRAQRITAYLNTVQEVVKTKFEKLKASVLQTEAEIDKYIKMLPDFSTLKQRFNHFVSTGNKGQKLLEWLNENLTPGDIDVNIMSKLDRERFKNGQKLPVEFNDAHAALRGFAKSKLQSSLVLSAGMNPRLYSYIEQFSDFYPDSNLNLRKKIVLKVSDYRSALIQGRFLAKKGIWVSEFRIESGLNCGGHAFATDGFLLGPVLEEFKTNKTQLIEAIHEIYVKALQEKGMPFPKEAFEIKVTAQGGVGNSVEHQFLLDHYKLDSIGWGTPFMLVPEATSVDKKTQDLLCEAVEKDLYMSEVSPLGVIFNNLRGNSMDLKKEQMVKNGKFGFPCTKKYLALSPIYSEQGICLASKEYQSKRMKELHELNLSPSELKKEMDKFTVKACLCNGLTSSALQLNNLDTTIEGLDVSICPGPNLAYFSKIVTLKEMVGHIYGKNNIIERNDRPNLFLKELKMYIEYLKTKINEIVDSMSKKQQKYFEVFRENLLSGIDYYESLFQKHKTKLEDKFSVINMLEELKLLKLDLQSLAINLACCPAQ